MDDWLRNRKDVGWLVTVFWLTATVVYVCKFLLPEWSRIISYGRLADNSREGKRERDLTVERQNKDLFHNALSKVLSFLLFPRIEYSIGFTSFYAIGCIFSMVLFYCRICHGWKTQGYFALVLFMIHTSRRLYETLFVHVYTKRKMHLLHWLSGASYYLFAALTFGSYCEQPCWSLSKRWLIFIFVGFLWSNSQQYVCHQHLAELRRYKGTDNKERYFIPYRGLFQYTACPHYLMEIIIYGMLVLCKGGTRNSVLNFIFVVLNLTARCIESWNWYNKYFGSERIPSHWRRRIPWLW